MLPLEVRPCAAHCLASILGMLEGACSPAAMVASLVPPTAVYPDSHPVDGFHPEGIPDAPLDFRFRKSEHGWTLCDRADATAAQLQLVRSVPEAWQRAFARQLSDLPGYSGPLGPVRIHLKDEAKRIAVPHRHHSRLEKEVQDIKCRELQEAGFIQCSSSQQFGLEVVVAAKKDSEGNWTDTRFCIDCRPLNAETLPDPWKPPRDAFELFDRIGTHTWLSKCDLRAAFNQLVIHPDDRQKTSFYWHGEKWMYKRMFYGLVNATAEFQKVLDYHIQKAGLQRCCEVYVDDIIIHSATPEQHAKDLEAVLQMLFEVGLRVHPDKTVVGADVLEFLGHLVCGNGIAPLEARVAALQRSQAPADVSQCRSLYGLFNYYRVYIEGFARISSPISDLLKKGVVWDRHTWQPEHAAALQQLKDALSTPGLGLHRVDPELELVVYCDWSNRGIGGVLGQLDTAGQERMCACISRSLNVHERNYGSYKGEMLAAVWVVKTLRPYLHGRHFSLITDHAPLKYLMGSKVLTGQYARWAMSLQEYMFTVHHRAGTEHVNVDSLSRLPLDSSADCTGARLDSEHDAQPPETVFSDSPPPGGGGRSYRSSTLGLPATHAALLPAHSMHMWQALQAMHAAAHTSVAADATCTADSLLETDAGFPHDPLLGDWHSLSDGMQRLARQSKQSKAARLVKACLQELKQIALAAPLTLQAVPAANIIPSQLTFSSLNTESVASAFIAATEVSGIVLYEPFGGMCSGLEACLRAGFVVARYLYSDTRPSSKASC